MEISVVPEFYGERLDKFVELKLKEFGFKQATRSMIKESIVDGVTVQAESKIKPSYRLKQGDVININEKYWKEFFRNKNMSSEIIAQRAKLNILYEDEYLIVLIKPKGMVVHPGVGNHKDTLANYVKGYLESKNCFDINMDRAGIVHRLDKGVSGIMVVAKSKEVQEELKTLFAKREVEKIYLAQVESYKSTELSHYPKKELDKVLETLVDTDTNYKDWFEAKGYIGRDKGNRYKMAFKRYQFEGSKLAKSYILPGKGNKMLIKIVTGRMHQIRATLYYYGYYIKGDSLYKPKRGNTASEAIMLKSVYLSFIHPFTLKRLSFIEK